MPPRLLASSLLCLAVLASACPAPTPTGDGKRGEAGPRLRLHEGAERTRARLVLETDARLHPVGPPTLHTFRFTIEEKTELPSHGRARVHARFMEVEGASGEPQLSDRLALAMDDLKLTFMLSERGETSDLAVEDMHAPLDEPMVRAIAFTLFGVGRGPRLPERAREAQDDYQVEADVEVLGVAVHQRHFFTFIGRTGAAVTVREKGHAEGIATTAAGTRRKIDGDTFGEETFDLERGVVRSGEYEWNVTVDDDPPAGRETPGVGRAHLRAERGGAVQPKK